jgi:predicted CoA-substrate-specific enzyme activase
MEGTGTSTGGLYGGVDVGSSATKVVLVEASGAVRGRAVCASGVDYAAAAEKALGAALEDGSAARADLLSAVATGYGRRNVAFAHRVLTEIQCHGLGCYYYLPRAITIVDIGGQDNKVIRLADSGQRLDFKMNRKCAAGTGAFLQEIALRLDLEPAELEPLARRTTEAVRLSSFCTVFAKTEILKHIRAGIPVEAIVRGAFRAVVDRVAEMDPLEGEVVLTGGVVAHNRTVGELLAERIGRAVQIAPDPQLTGALGAALSARERGAAG